MGKLTVSEILEATGGVLVSGKAEAEITGIETDSRKADFSLGGTFNSTMKRSS